MSILAQKINALTMKGLKTSRGGTHVPYSPKSFLWIHFLYIFIFALYTIRSGYDIVSGELRGQDEDIRVDIWDWCSSSTKNEKEEEEKRRPKVLPERREDRFPSVDERVRMYMSDWYVPPCDNYTDGFTQYNPLPEQGLVVVGNEFQGPLGLPTRAVLSRLFAGYREEFIRNKNNRTFVQYTADVVGHIIPAMERIGGWADPDDADAVPLLIEYGDLRNSRGLGYLNFPHIKKFRSSYTKEEIAKKTAPECYLYPRPIRARELEAIIMKLNSGRHYSMLGEISAQDTPWVEKKNMAVFRGKKTGPSEARGMPGEVARCFEYPRCRLVYQNLNSTLVDAVLTGRTEPSFGGIRVLGKPLTIQEQLKYKAVIMVEGMDVATGLKWALLSNSVVMMPPVTKSTWMMEELLEPWVHYIPIDLSFTEVEEKMQWIIDNDEEAEIIAKRGALWIKDLIYHADSQRDNDLVEEEVLRRYLKHFRLNKQLERKKKERQ